MTDEEMNLLMRSLDDELERAERERLDALLESSSALRAERDRLRYMRSMLAAGRAESFSLGFADRVLDAALPQRQRHEGVGAGWLDRLVLAVQPRRLAGGLAVLVLVAAGILLWTRPLTTTVPFGEMETVTLSDGSTVELSGGSSLTYRRFALRDERRVELDGEAFFDVEAGDRPFVVETFNADVRVLGTRFNVRAWPDDPDAATDVALAEGRVAVEPRGTPRAAARTEARTLALQSTSGPLVLEPGQAATVGADSAAALLDVSLDRALAWRSGGLAFADRPLASVFRSIERRFGVRVVADDATIARKSVTYLNPSPTSPEEVLSDICHTLDLRYRRTSDGFQVFTPLDQ